MAIADVTVVGGGIFGLAIAWECGRRGARVRLIERERIGAGSSGGIVGALAPHVPEQWNPKKQFQLESLLMAQDFWDGVAATGCVDPGYARLGRLQPVADDAALALAKDRAHGAEALWQGRADWRLVRAEAYPGWAPESPTGWLIEDTLSARLHPRHAAAALVAAIRAKGGAVEVGAADPAPGPVIWATGAPGLAELSAALGRPVGAGVKGQAALFACAAADRPQLFADGLHIVPHADGTVAVGSTSERDFEDGRVVDDRLEPLIDKARALCPALADAAVIERWAGVRPRSKSRAPMLGRWPERAGQFIANGGFKIGFGMAPKVAEVMADLVLEGRDTIPAGFRVEDNL
ncbi:NAD(P)/FAD-dependent oxidoreductase [Albidovulum sediminicola]|uniref:FAD-binding oxidoreductase n=1 Tax=Albidovulum sediminicola TaxID=2984331 RepID=A0ABT2YZD2_9RHOB|nr:FAD-binding oxidoreductase [Defluviimonas sp. WL0075]MCV2864145.1 FAD-binding oxidoreductase [Defluviimonas sp. WL0075]